MRNLLFIKVIFCYLIISSCGDDTPVEPIINVKVEDDIATVVKMPEDASCDYLLLYSNYFFPSNLPDSLKEHDLDVIVSFEFVNQYQTCTFNDGTTTESEDFQVIQITNIRKY